MSVCPICGGVGLIEEVSPTGLWVSRACECQQMEREQNRLAAAHIPQRYRDCTLDDYEIYHEADRSLSRGLQTARKFVDALQTGDEETALQMLDPSLRDEKASEAMRKLPRLAEGATAGNCRDDRRLSRTASGAMKRYEGRDH